MYGRQLLADRLNIGDAFVEDIQNAKAAGMNGHMAKPLDYEGLSQEINKYLK